MEYKVGDIYKAKNSVRLLSGITFPPGTRCKIVKDLGKAGKDHQILEVLFKGELDTSFIDASEVEKVN